MVGKSPQEQLDADIAEQARLTALAESAGNIVSRFVYKARAAYAGFLIGEDLIDLECSSFDGNPQNN